MSTTRPLSLSLRIAAIAATFAGVNVASAAPNTMVDWSSVFDMDGTPIASRHTTTALLRDGLSFNRAIEATVRKRVGNAYSAALFERGRLPRQHDIGNSYFHAETVGNSSIVHLASERLYRGGNTTPTSVRFLLSKARSGFRRNGDISAQVRFARNGKPGLFLVHKFDNGKWLRMSVAKFNVQTGCAGNSNRTVACVERVGGAIVEGGPVPRGRHGVAVNIPPVNERVRLRLNLSALDDDALACTHLAVFTPRDIAEGSVHCLPNAKPYRLRRVTNAALVERQIKDGLIEHYGYVPYIYTGNADSVVVAASSSSPPPSTPAASPTSGSSPAGGSGGTAGSGAAVDVSGTNVQEIGVDEYDRVKTNGDYVYIMSNERASRSADSRGQRSSYISRNYDLNLNVVDISPGNATSSAIAQISIATNTRERGTGMYLYEPGNALIITANESSFNYWSNWYTSGGWGARESSIIEVDISDPAAPAKHRTLNINGEVVSSRRIGNTLYVASRSFPKIEGLQPFRLDSAAADVQIARIEGTTLNDLLPTYTTDRNQTPRPLVSATDCVISANRGERAVSADIMTVSAIDLDTMDVRSSRCFVGDTETFYMTTRSIYLATTRYEYEIRNGVANYRNREHKTDIHRFRLNDSLTYRASGTVPGHLGWNIERKPWRFSEDGEVLRVVTMTDEAKRGGSPITLTMLKDTGSGRLDVIASLPNSARPEPLGKPGERLHASRFIGDQGYIVTFRKTDPLYVLDLSDASDPRVTGALEIEGYSDYLHPVGEGLILGVGKDAVSADLGDGQGAWYQGVKLSLFDVSNPARPTEVDNVIIGKRGTESSALSTHKAFTFRPARDGNPARLALAMKMSDTGSRWGPPGAPSTFANWTHSGAYLYEIDEGNAPAIRATGKMIVDSASDGPRYDSRDYRQDRTILADDAVYLIREDSVYGAKWSTPENWTSAD